MFTHEGLLSSFNYEIQHVKNMQLVVPSLNLLHMQKDVRMFFLQHFLHHLCIDASAMDLYQLV